jgi:hypothetical protein
MEEKLKDPQKILQAQGNTNHTLYLHAWVFQAQGSHPTFIISKSLTLAMHDSRNKG